MYPSTQGCKTYGKWKKNKMQNRDRNKFVEDIIIIRFIKLKCIKLSIVINDWINATCSINTMEYYLAIKRNGVLIHATTWMTLKYMLSERSQTQKTAYYMIPFI